MEAGSRNGVRLEGSQAGVVESRGADDSHTGVDETGIEKSSCGDSGCRKWSCIGLTLAGRFRK
jgi:hypothetical protein